MKVENSTRLWRSDDYAADSALCLEFANTRSWRGKPNPSEELNSPNEWLQWTLDHGAASEEVVAALRQKAAERPEEALAAFDKAIGFRESLYNLLYAHSLQLDAPAKDRMAVQSVLQRALARLQLTQRAQGWDLEPDDFALDWDAPLFGPALSAAQLLTGEYATKVRSCGRPECLWLFLDLTKNHSRKWCSMQTCGNVVKARANYLRKKRNTVAED